MSSSQHHDVIPITQSYQHAAEIFVHNIWKIVGAALVPNILTIILLLAFQRSFNALFVAFGARDSFAAMIFSPLLLMTLLFFTIIIVQLLGNIAVTYIVVHQERTGIVNAYEHAMEFFWRFVKLGVALFCITILGYLAGIFIMMIIGIVLGKFNIELVTDAFTWLSLLPVIMGSIVSIFFIFAGYDILDRDVNVMKGLSRSFHLVRGHLFAVLVRAGLLYAAVAVLVLALRLLPFIGNMIALIFIAPFSVLYLSTLYNNLKTLKPL